MAEHVSQSDLDRMLASLPAMHDERYQVRLENLQGCLFLRMTGTLLQPIPDEFIARLQDLFRRNTAQRAVVDLSRCQFISSSAIGVLMEYFKASTAHGGQVLLIQPTEKVMKLIEILRLTRFFLVVEDDQMALRYFAEQARLPGSVSDS